MSQVTTEMKINILLVLFALRNNRRQGRVLYDLYPGNGLCVWAGGGLLGGKYGLFDCGGGLPGGVPGVKVRGGCIS